MLARPRARQNSGLLYYTRECTDSDKLLVRGVDELKDYQIDSKSIRNPVFTMHFTRRFHKYPDGSFDETTPAYRFHCKVKDRFGASPKLYVETEIPNEKCPDQWKGVFQKH